MAVLLGRVDGGHNLYCLLLASHGLLLVHSYSAIQLGGIEKRCLAVDVVWCPKLLPRGRHASPRIMPVLPYARHAQNWGREEEDKATHEKIQDGGGTKHNLSLIFFLA